MKDEIKEILEDYKKLAGEITEKLDNTAEYESWLIVQDYFDKLLDHITNLQEKCESLDEAYKNLQQEKDSLDDYARHLHNENKRLKEVNEEHRKLNGNLRTANNTLCEVEEFMYNQAKEYKARIDKAIKYMNNYNELVVPDADIKSLILKEEYKKIINLLQGKSDE